MIILVYGRRDERLRAYTINWHYFVPGRSDAQCPLFALSGRQQGYIRSVPEADVPLINVYQPVNLSGRNVY